MDVLSADWLGICRRAVAAQRGDLRGGARASRSAPSTRGSARAATARWSSTAAARTRSSPSSRRWPRRAPRSSPSPRSAARSSFGEGGAGAGGDRPDRRLAQRPPHAARRTASASPSPPAPRWPTSSSATSTTSAPARSSSPRRGEGATLDGEPIEVGEDREKLELLGLESAEPEWALPALEALAGKVYRLRVVGSIAITASYVAAGRFDAMLSLRPCRSVDAAAAQLIVREAGGRVAFGDLPLERAASASTPATRSPPPPASAAWRSARGRLDGTGCRNRPRVGFKNMCS